MKEETLQDIAIKANVVVNATVSDVLELIHDRIESYTPAQRWLIRGRIISSMFSFHYNGGLIFAGEQDTKGGEIKNKRKAKK